jgi:hypothetical protein
MSSRAGVWKKKISRRLSPYSPYSEIVHLLLCLTAPLRVLLLIRHYVGAFARLSPAALGRKQLPLRLISRLKARDV